MQTPTSGTLQAVAQFLENLKVIRKLSPHTVRAYQQDLQTLSRYLLEHRLEAHQVTRVHTRSFIAQRHSAGASPRSLARMLSAWRTFFDWLIARHSQAIVGTINSNPVQDLRAPRKSKSLPKALSVEYAIVLMEKAQAQTVEHCQAKDAWVYYRDHAILELFYSSGLRLSEILGIDCSLQKGYAKDSLGWIAWTSQEVHVFGKGGKRRIVPIGAAAMQALQVWFEVWARVFSSQALSQGPLFINQQAQRLSPRTLQQRIKILAQKAGLPMHVHPHMLRHSFASHVLQSSHDLRAVQEMLGHASIGSTQIYTALDFQHLAQAYDQAHPRAKANK